MASNKKIKLLTWIVIIFAAFAAYYFAAGSIFTLENIQHVGKKASTVTSSHPFLVFLALVLIQIIGMTLSLPTKAIFTLLAGALLGTILGTIATVTGVMLGTSVLFFAIRHVLRDRVSKKLSGRVKQIEERISNRPIRAMIGIRLLIALPFGPCTISAALSSMRYRDFFIGTMLGDLPVVILYSFAGNKLFVLASTGDALSPTTVAILIALGLILFAGALFGKKPKKMAGRMEKDSATKTHRV